MPHDPLDLPERDPNPPDAIEIDELDVHERIREILDRELHVWRAAMTFGIPADTLKSELIDGLVMGHIPKVVEYVRERMIREVKEARDV